MIRVDRISMRAAVPLALALTLGTLQDARGARAATVAAGADDVAALDLLGKVPVMLEHRGGYDRGMFPGWVDADRDGCDTRAEVLRRESRSPVRTTTVRCTVVSGDWVSAYDGLVISDPSRLEIDHVVGAAPV